MPRRNRKDTPGSVHHVMNRGIARRPVFENRADFRFFMSLLARCVHDKVLSIEAFTIMTTHFHVLVESLQGDLAGAMAWIQSEYTRRFNRTRFRDGPLFRGRFASRLVDAVEYELVVRAYIHDNPVDAGMVAAPEEYPYSSARFLTSKRPPRWIDPRLRLLHLPESAGPGIRTEKTSPIFAAPAFGELKYIVEGGILGPRQDARFKDLVSFAPEDIKSWFRERTQLADGCAPGQPACSPDRIIMAIRRHYDLGSLDDILRSYLAPVLRPMWVGLLRNLSACSITRISAETGLGRSTAHRALVRHDELMVTDDSYATLVSQVAFTALAEWRRLFASLGRGVTASAAEEGPGSTD